MDIQYIVSGTGRCGTVYLAKLLTSLGIPCGHESIFDNNREELKEKILKSEIFFSHASLHMRTPSNSGYTFRPLPKWTSKEIVADSSYMSAPYLGDPLIQNVAVIHLIRHPLKVITSFVKDGQFFKEKYPSNAWEDFIYSFLPNMKNYETQIDRTAYFYINWNKLIFENGKKHSRYFLHRIEDDLNNLFEFLGKSNPSFFYNDKKANSWNLNNRPDFEIADIVNHGLKLEISNFIEENYKK